MSLTCLLHLKSFASSFPICMLSVSCLSALAGTCSPVSPASLQDLPCPGLGPIGLLIPPASQRWPLAVHSDAVPGKDYMTADPPILLLE